MLNDKIDTVFDILAHPHSTNSQKYHAVRSLSEAEHSEALKQARQLYDVQWGPASVIIDELEKFGF